MHYSSVLSFLSSRVLASARNVEKQYHALLDAITDKILPSRVDGGDLAALPRCYVKFKVVARPNVCSFAKTDEDSSLIEEAVQEGLLRRVDMSDDYINFFVAPPPPPRPISRVMFADALEKYLIGGRQLSLPV